MSTDSGNGYDYEDFLSETDQAAPEPTPRKVIPPGPASALEGDDLAQAFLSNSMVSLLATVTMKATGASDEELQKFLTDTAIEAAARFRGRVLVGQASL